MSRFVSNAIEDMRCGRQNWRIMVLFCLPSFAITVLTVFFMSLAR